jgi:transposase-like protein
LRSIGLEEHEGVVLESYVTKRRDRKAALKFLRKSMKRYGNPEIIVTDRLRSYGAAIKVIGNANRQETGRWLNNRAEGRGIRGSLAFLAETGSHWSALSDTNTLIHISA